MPIHDHDPFDDSGDIRDYLERLRRSRQRDAQGANSEWGPPPPRRTRRKRVVAVLTAILLTVATALFSEYQPDGNGDGNIGTEQPQGPVIAAERMYAQRDVRAYRAPFGDSMVVRRIKRGESVLLGEQDGRRWAKLYEPDGDSIGFVYVYNNNFASTPPTITEASNRH